jgi:hypothetical protein
LRRGVNIKSGDVIKRVHLQRGKPLWTSFRWQGGGIVEDRLYKGEGYLERAW